MVFIRATHDLTEPGAAVPELARAQAWTRYGYLFPDLADDPNVGCFAGTDEAGTIARLKAFEVATHLPFNPPAALLMRLPAAYTYFGQFLNHDISAPVGSVSVVPEGMGAAGVIGDADPPGLGKTWRADRATILARIINEQGRPLMLGSLYGDWPEVEDADLVALYEPDRMRFRLGQTAKAPAQEFLDLEKDPETIVQPIKPDLQRRGREALIADRRNDGNLVLSQMHLAFLRVHNRAVDMLEPKLGAGEACFLAARRLVTLHYHWLILHDFLPRLLSRSVLTRPLSEWPARPGTGRAVPMEFTTAAFRFGHSMVGRAYDFNANFGQGGRITSEAKLMDLIRFTSAHNMGHPEGPARPLPAHWVIDWDRMTAGRTGGARRGGHSGAERIDLHFAPDMLNVAGDATVPEHGSIMFRNLLRGFHRRIPFGQKLAEACGVPRLDDEQIRAAFPRHASSSADFASPLAAAEALGMIDEMPAWLYFLCEARALERGERVGPTASRIIADTVVGLMRADAGSLLRQEGREWHPRDSVLRDKNGRALETLRSFLMFSDEG